MKFYNPFKPHIATFEEGFVIRRRLITGWKYLDRTDNNWWWDVLEYSIIPKYCMFSTSEAALENYTRRTKELAPPKKPEFYATL